MQETTEVLCRIGYRIHQQCYRALPPAKDVLYVPYFVNILSQNIIIVVIFTLYFQNRITSEIRNNNSRRHTVGGNRSVNVDIFFMVQESRFLSYLQTGKLRIVKAVIELYLNL